MKYFYSYYSCNQKSNEDLFFMAMCIKLSSTLLKKMNKTVGIYSDSKFIELLKKYEVDLNFYENIEDEIKNIQTKKLFAVCKLYSNIIQSEPFIQIDTDLFLFDNLDFNLLETSLISFYSLETISWTSPPEHYFGWKLNYLDLYNIFSEKFPHIVQHQYTNPLYAYNCAIVGGLDWKIYKEIYEPMFKLIKDNKTFVENLGDYPMLVLEQHIITGHLAKLGYNLSNINFVSQNRLPYIEPTDTNFFFKVNEKNEPLLTLDNNGFFECHPNKIKELVKEKFSGSIHLQGAKGLIGIRNLIYEMLRYYNPNYVNWLEKKFGKEYQFQKNIINSLI